MNILLQARVDLFERPGGDTRQIIELCDQLQKHGVRARVALDTEPDLHGIDVVHLFNITRVHETCLQLLHAKRHHRPTILTPIYHDLSDYNQRGRRGLSRWSYQFTGRNDDRLEHLRLLHAYRHDRRQRKAIRMTWKYSYRRLQRWVVTLADHVLPNSKAEQDAIEDTLGISLADRVTVLPVGLDTSLLSVSPQPFHRKYGTDPFVLSVGRFEPLKNQLALAQVLGKENIPLVLIGRRNPNHHSYTDQLLALANQYHHLHVLEDIPRAITESAFAACRVHALVSWTETTGLVNLEAGLAGAALVATSGSYAMQDLTPSIHICDPGDPASILAAVQEAWKTIPKNALSALIARRFGWPSLIPEYLRLYRHFG